RDERVGGASASSPTKGSNQYGNQYPDQDESNTKILDWDQVDKAHPQKEKLSTKIKKIFN
ncbi:hypothetical protein WICPIJ_003040, partial [Wickerhamomyces pijperi]